MKWSQEEIDTLVELYPNNTNEFISSILNRTIPSIFRKSRDLKLFKTKEHKSMIVKSRTRDLSYEFLLNRAKEFKSKSDFKKTDSGAYSRALDMGILEEICNHMIPQSISIPQLILNFIIRNIFSEATLYNTRNIIKPYELDIYLPKYKLAFEFDGSHWHKNKKDIDLIKNELCLKEKIKLIRIGDKCDIPYDYYKNIIQSIKNDLISNLKEINKHCRIKIIKNQILEISNDEILNYVRNNILDYEKIEQVTKKYDDYKEFKILEKSLYVKLYNMGLLKEYTKHMKKDIIYWNIDLCKEEIDKYTTFSEFYKKSYKCYIHIQRNNLCYLLEKYDDLPISYTDEYINNIIKNYDNFTLFRKENMNLYVYLVNNNKLDMTKNLKRQHNRHDLSEIYKHDYSRYKNTYHFKNENRSLFSYAVRNNLTDFINEEIKHK